MIFNGICFRVNFEFLFLLIYPILYQIYLRMGRVDFRTLFFGPFTTPYVKAHRYIPGDIHQTPYVSMGLG